MSALKLVVPRAEHSGPIPDIGNYLDRLGTRLRIGEPRRSEVLIEIEDHVRDRTRDLMVNGLAERDALAKAIGELPEPAVLAARLTAAIKLPQRRRIMNMAIFGLGGVAILSALTVMSRPGDQQVASVYTPPAAQSTAGAAQIGAQRNATWDGFFASAGKAASMPVFVHWAPLAEIDNNIHLGAGMTVELGEGLSLDRALGLVNDALNLGEDDGVAYRVEDGTLVFSTTAYFDRRDTVLTSFDLSDLAVSPGGEPMSAGELEVLMRNVSTLIQKLVHENLWGNNGGDRAAMNAFGSKLFIKAPKRIIPKIEWVLREIRSGRQANADVRRTSVLTGSSANSPRAAAATESHTFPLGHSSCINVADFLTEAAKASPALSSGGGLKVFAVAQQNALIVVGSTETVKTVESLLALIDRPAPVQQGGGSETRTTTLQHIRAGTMRALLGSAFDASPAMKQSAVVRLLETDESEGRLTITAATEQVAWAGDLIKLIDSDGPNK